MANFTKNTGAFHSHQELLDNVLRMSNIVPRMYQKEIALRCEISEATVSNILTELKPKAKKKGIDLDDYWIIRGENDGVT
jgi:hypothetical protein